MLVFIPGLLSDETAWTDVANSVRVAHRFADVTRDTSISAMAQRLLHEFDGELIAAGHSMGGRVAMEMARIAPHRLRGLVLANTGHHPKRDGEEIRRQQMIDRGHRDMDELVETWLPPMVDPARLGDAKLMGRLKEMALKAGAAVHERQIRALVGRPDALSDKRGLDVPALLIAARQDSWSPISQHQEIADVLPDAELMIVEDAGHFAPAEQPEAVASAINDWLARKFGESNV